jgi:hypothetical protein
MERKHMTVRIVGRILAACIVLVTLAACSAGSGANTATPVIPTPLSAGTAAPLGGSPSVPTALPASSPAPVSGGLNFVRTITNADNGATVQIKVGDRIALVLQASTGFDPWDVAPTDAHILMSVPNPAAAAARGVTLRAYLAAGPGQATIMATDRIHCDTTQGACAGAIQDFHVTVVITP